MRVKTRGEKRPYRLNRTMEIGHLSCSWTIILLFDRQWFKDANIEKKDLVLTHIQDRLDQKYM